MTKQAVTSNNVISEKSKQNGGYGRGSLTNKHGSLVTISSQSPMEQLLQSESSIVHNKATVEETASKKTTQEEATKKTSDATISNSIQSLSDHLKKVDDKSDMTAALEENDKRTIHPKVMQYENCHSLFLLSRNRRENCSDKNDGSSELRQFS